MPLPFSLAQQQPPVSMLAPAADAAGRTSAYLSLKNCAKGFIIVHVNQGNAATILLSLLQAQDVSGTASKAGPSVNIVADLDEAAGDAFVAQTAGATFTTDAGVKIKVVIFEVDPASLDVANGFKTVAISTGASNAANITSAIFVPVGLRYVGSAPPSFVIN